MASEGTAFPSCSRKVRERRSCVGFAPGHVCECVLSEYGKSPSAAGLSRLGCAHEAMTYPSDSFRCRLERQRCLVEETLPGNEESQALSPLAFPSLHRAMLSVMGFGPRFGCRPAPQCKSIFSIVVTSTATAAICDYTLTSDYTNPRVKRYG